MHENDTTSGKGWRLAASNRRLEEARVDAEIKRIQEEPAITDNLAAYINTRIQEAVTPLIDRINSLENKQCRHKDNIDGEIDGVRPKRR
jgi:hypothetical protein